MIYRISWILSASLLGSDDVMILAPVCKVCEVLEEQLFVTSQFSRLLGRSQLWFLWGELFVKIRHIFRSSLQIQLVNRGDYIYKKKRFNSNCRHCKEQVDNNQKAQQITAVFTTAEPGERESSVGILGERLYCILFASSELSIYLLYCLWYIWWASPLAKNLTIGSTIINDKILTIVGTKGGGTFLFSRSSQFTFLKNACFFTSSASRSVAPSRRSGLFRSN